MRRLAAPFAALLFAAHLSSACGQTPPAVGPGSKALGIAQSAAESLAAGTFRAVSAAALGLELTTGGAFTGSLAGWAIGTGWAYRTNTAVWTVGTPGALSQSIYVLAGVSYLIQWDQTNSSRSNGTITPSLGSMSGLPLGFQTTGLFPGNQQIITAAASGFVTLSFIGAAVGTPTGTITLDNVSVKAITPATATVSLQDTNGSADTQFSPGGAGLGNNFFGLNAGQYSLGLGYQNTADGGSVLVNLTSGFGNTGGGFGALHSNTTGYNNTGYGRQALYNNIAGWDNVAMGLSSMIANTSGSENTAIGTSSLENNTTGWSNAALGNGGLTENTTGAENTSGGENSLFNSNGDYNTGYGFSSGFSLTTGNANILLGYFAGGYTLTTGSSNILIGNGADVPTGSTSNYLNIANVFTDTNTNAPSSSVASLSAGTFNLAASAFNINGFGFGSATQTITADQSTGFSAILSLVPKLGYGVGLIQTTTNSPLVLATNSVTAATIDTSGNMAVVGNVTAPGFRGNLVGSGTSTVADLVVNSTDSVAGAWTTVAVPVTGSGGAFTSASATLRYKKIGHTVYESLVVNITTAGTGNAGAAILATMPFSNGSQPATLAGGENAVNGKAVWGTYNASSSTLTIRQYDGSGPVLTTGGPYQYILSGVHESAS